MMAGFGRRMLLVEHDDNERNVLGRMLENEGYLVHQVSQECLALEEMKRRRFDVVISAHHLPQINGFRLVLMARLVWPDTPMILLSGNDTSLSEAVEKGGPYGSLRKPYHFSELLKLMKNSIELSRKHRSRRARSISLPS